ncbi:MAG: hypothetical protein ACTSXJ_10105 [Candidatus Baldrarchaeia archaeon]
MCSRDPVLIFRNRDVRRVIAGIPRGHAHLRVVIETEQGTFVFQEATVAALVRAYVSVKTHPSRRAIELRRVFLEDERRKRGYAEFQLLESDKPENKVLEDLERILESASAPDA